MALNCLLFLNSEGNLIKIEVMKLKIRFKGKTRVTVIGFKSKPEFLK